MRSGPLPASRLPRGCYAREDMGEGTHTIEGLANGPAPGGLVRALARACVRYKVVAAAPEGAGAAAYRSAPERGHGTLATPGVLARAEALGLRFLGTYAFLGLFGWIPREAWATEDGVVRLSARRAAATGLEGEMSTYFLSTTFDDGSVLLTWSRSPAPLASTGAVESLGGSGDLAADLAIHRRALERRAEASPARPLVVDSVDDAVLLSRYFDRALTTDAQARAILVPRLVVWGGLAALAIAALAAIARRLA